jgi:tetratricopeptide (TPR) repeat protein
MAACVGLVGRPVAAASPLPDDRPLWILGDLRGDALALAAALAFVDEADGGEGLARVALLGDWCGGTSADAATAAMVLERFNAAPERTLLLRGDREWLLATEAEGTLPDAPHAGRMPVAEAHQALRRSWLQALAGLVPHLPVAALLGEGTLLAHGALPRASRLASLTDWTQLQSSEAALRDFAFGRLHPRQDRVQAGEREGGVIAGAEDFRESLGHMARLADRPVHRLVRGQDAAPEGHRWFRAYGEGRVLTLTTLADRLPQGSPRDRRCPCVARLKAGRLRVVQLDVPEEVALLAEQLFPMAIGGPAAPASLSSRVMVQAAAPQPAAVAVIEDPADGVRREPAAMKMAFERGVRLLKSRAWAGARDAFREIGTPSELRDAALVNEAVACLGLGPPGHQDALACLRQLRQAHPRCAEVHFNLGIAFLAGERNPSEAVRSLRLAVEIDPELADAWWALGLAAAMRHDAATAATAFARAAAGGCELAAPGSLHGGIPVRELMPAMDALRGLARHQPGAGAAFSKLHP